MLFNTITALLSLTALVSAAPRPESGLTARDAALHFHPRHVHAVEARDGQQDDRRGQDQNSNPSNRNRFNNDDVIIDTTVIILSEVQKQQEAELVVIVQEQVKRRGGHNFEKRKQKDQIRRNHYRNRNKNVNTVIVVVTEIIDVRDSNNRRSRYMTRQVRADNGRAQDVTVIVQDVVAITISSDDSNRRNGGNGRENSRNGPIGSPAPATRTRDVLDLQAKASATAAALSAIQTVDPAAPFLPSNRTVMLPPGAAFPGFASVEPDPARIVEEGITGVFVGSE